VIDRPRLDLSLVCWLLLVAASPAWASHNAPADSNTGGSSIDQFLEQQLAAEGISPGPACSDAQFLRRATLDACGRLPTLEERTRFLSDPKPGRRHRLIERLLGSHDASQRWAVWMAEWTGCHAGLNRQVRRASARMRVPPESFSKMWVEWLRVRLERDEPYDQIVAGFLLATTRDGRPDHEAIGAQHDFIKRVKSGDLGSREYARRRTNDLFWRVHLENRELIGSTVANTFLGVEIECARCHDHPDGQWTQRDFSDFHAVFGRLTHAKAPPVALQRRVDLVRSASMAGATLLAALFLLATYLARRGRRIPARWTLCGGLLMLAGGVYATSCFSHLLVPVVTTRVTSPGLWITNWWLGDRTGHMVFYLAIALLGGLALLATTVGCRRLLVSVGPRPGIAASLAILAGALLVATAADAASTAKQPNARLREPLLNRWRRELTSRQQPDRPRRDTEIYLEPLRPDTDSVPTLFDKTAITDAVDDDPRRTLLAWMLQPPQREMDRVIVNRVWNEWFGRKLAHGDQLRLLEWLVDDFRRHKRSLRHLHRLIMNSRAYQRSSQPVAGSEVPANDSYARFSPRPIPGRALLRSIAQASGTAVPDSLASPGVLPGPEDAAERGTRILCGQPEAAPRLRVEAAMYLLVDSTLQQRLGASGGRLDQLLARQSSPEQTLDSIFLACLCRPPSRRERLACLEHVGPDVRSLDRWSDVLWALVNSREFQFIR